MGNFAKSQTFFARIGKTPGKDLITPAKQRGTLHECHTYRLIIDSLCRAVPHRHHGRAVRSLSLFLRCPLRKAPRFCRAAHAWKGSRILQASRWGRAQRARPTPMPAETAASRVPSSTAWQEPRQGSALRHASLCWRIASACRASSEVTLISMYESSCA